MKFFFLPFLHSCIIPRRIPILIKRYATISDKSGACIMHATFSSLAQQLQNRGHDVENTYLYGENALSSALAKLPPDPHAHVIPLMISETKGFRDKIASVLQPYPTVTCDDNWLESDPAYHALLRQSILDHYQNHQPDAILTTFHSLPNPLSRATKDYARRCQRLFRQLQCAPVPHFFCYQSKFGPGPWLGPRVEKTLDKLKKEGYQKIAILPASFAFDGLETCHELGIIARQHWLDIGGTDLTTIPCPNDRRAFVDLIEARIMTREGQHDR